MSAESHRSRSRSPAARRSHSPRRSSRSPPRRSSRSPPRHSSRSRSRSPPRGGARLTGLALRWNPKGFGFIKPDDGSEDVFCHTTAIKDGNALREGDKVEYEKVFDDRQQKDRAQNVTGGCQEDRPRFDERSGGGGREVCRDFEKGRCTRGSSCRFSHGDAGRDGGRGSYRDSRDSRDYGRDSYRDSRDSRDYGRDSYRDSYRDRSPPRRSRSRDRY